MKTDLEYYILADVLFSPDVLNFENVSKIRPEHFSQRKHQATWAAIKELLAAGETIDLISVCEKAKDQSLFAYLAEVMNKTTSVLAGAGKYTDDYAKKLFRNHRQRQLAQAAQEVIKKIHDGEENGVIENYLSTVLSSREEQAEISHIKPIAQAVLTEIKDLYDKGDEITGLRTGFKDLDDKTAGLHAGQLIIIAGRPAMGKTTLAMNIAENAAVSQSKRCLVFSLEMTKEELTKRVLASQGNLDYSHIRTPSKMQCDSWSKLAAGATKAIASNILISDQAGITVDEIAATSHRVAAGGDLDLIVIDYLQLIRGEKGVARIQQVTEISGRLKQLAKELGVPVVALSQLSRECEKRPDKRPMCSDLRESGSIEQDADLIAFVYRDEVYDEDSKRKGVAELIIGKQRSGEIGTIYLASRLNVCRFDNLSNYVPEQKETKKSAFY